MDGMSMNLVRQYVAFHTRRLLLRPRTAIVFVSCRKPAVHVRYQSNRAKRSGNDQWKWFGVPWSLGIACLTALQIFKLLRQDVNVAERKTWQLSAFRLLPARMLSRAAGDFMAWELPHWIRRPILGLYVWTFGCQMEEAEVEDLQSYQSLMELFTRRLKHGARTVSAHHELVSPSDGRILHFGKMNSSRKLEQIKGVTYHLDSFLGPELLQNKSDFPLESSGHIMEECRKERECSQLMDCYHIIIYLAPGDYHHFHSPANWNITTRRHFPGELLTVAPWAARTMPGLFALNERVVLYGQWRHGFFSVTAVGAYNVGSINLAVEENLQTNVKGRYTMGDYTEKKIEAIMQKGERLGHFSLGSSIVLVFEAPKNFKFHVKPGQNIKCGQPLGSIYSVEY